MSSVLQTKKECFFAKRLEICTDIMFYMAVATENKPKSMVLQFICV